MNGLRAGLARRTSAGLAEAAGIPTMVIVVPCFNEQAVLPQTAQRLGDILDRLAAARRVSDRSSILFVDDGSTDRTWSFIRELHLQSRRVGGIRLSRNRGHQNALLAGLLAAAGDWVISIDADLQDDIEAIPNMVAAAAAGAQIVFGVRRGRASDSAGKRLTARLYYRLLALLKVEIVYDHADFRLMSRRAIEALREYGEVNLFLRALIPQLGFETAVVEYDRLERAAGSSKYSLWKMLSLAVEGVTSFSTRPLRIVTALGLLISTFAGGLTLWAVASKLFFDTAVVGWASTVAPTYLLSGVQLLCLGIIGEYVGKIYAETKRRPRSHLSEALVPGRLAKATRYRLRGPRSTPASAEHGPKSALAFRSFGREMREDRLEAAAATPGPKPL